MPQEVGLPEVDLLVRVTGKAVCADGGEMGGFIGMKLAGNGRVSRT